jgi:regulator of cell morphogenesis and NO signaling
VERNLLVDAGMQHRDETLGDLATNLPAATRVFLRNRLDFCCGGKRTLARACEQAGLDVDAIVGELEAEAARAGVADGWAQRSLAELADHIERHYHAALRRDVPPLIAAARKVERVHADKPAVPAGLADLLARFWDEMERHMEKEERVLFPMIRRGTDRHLVSMPVRVMEQEHDAHGASLAAIRALTDDLRPPAHACATWRALYDGLRFVEAELMQHIHLENNVLFRRAAGAVG